MPTNNRISITSLHFITHSSSYILAILTTTHHHHHHQHMKSDVGKKGASRASKQRPCSTAGLTLDCLTDHLTTPLVR
jgi:transcriptional regulator of heat shock response